MKKIVKKVKKVLDNMGILPYIIYIEMKRYSKPNERNFS